MHEKKLAFFTELSAYWKWGRGGDRAPLVRYKDVIIDGPLAVSGFVNKYVKKKIVKKPRQLGVGGGGVKVLAETFVKNAICFDLLP